MIIPVWLDVCACYVEFCVSSFHSNMLQSGEVDHFFRGFKL